ncbi:YbaB/EbfC family nucleoid-associated protein [Actinomadura sp. ATCC 31491]|uniref:YbaB/EbfC family nucleoid-associated protein n=1 Tax=Actinomadura luzonensis TaxID=2805427 RepID=A0ABT0FSN6_9ACTN|nr:YbaB/EbfC family nucleoid-associated protein [Actinomadura luzonensis]MCK2215010.1 YbaB/EbfC family nucleoid-associated protein [Actinomadura luzonensis]
MAERDLRSGDLELDRLMAEFQASSRELSDVMGLVGDVTGQAESPDGKIRVRVSSSGQLTGLHLDPRAMRLGSQELAEAIMRLSRRAAEDAARRLMDVARPYLDGPAGEAGTGRPRR